MVNRILAEVAAVVVPGRVLRWVAEQAWDEGAYWVWGVCTTARAYQVQDCARGGGPR